MPHANRIPLYSPLVLQLKAFSGSPIALHPLLAQSGSGWVPCCRSASIRGPHVFTHVDDEPLQAVKRCLIEPFTDLEFQKRRAA